MTTPTEPPKADYVCVALSADKTRVRLTITNAFATESTVTLDQQAALALAGEIQGWALQVAKSFTHQQIRDWKAYELVRLSGRFNMLADPRARHDTGLSEERYSYVMGNYSELRDAAEKTLKQEPNTQTVCQ